ncbi:hypothetical protein FRC03_003403 [Tulasnella sp. 419]|nr:hypothetical protein FRC02_012362 [Tulasnella sp. 418]KAG8942273.1 hypothetical protein FRC03_003403 [Tulasnella sp. 419]
MKFLNILAAAVVVPSALASAIVPRQRNTPDFYLVAVSSNTNYHLKPLLFNNYAASLTTGTPAVGYVDGGINFRIELPNQTYGYISGSQIANGCNPDGPLLFVVGSSSNKCAKGNPFAIQSYDQNAQLGAKLVFNWTGSFYACSGGAVYWYSGTPGSGCSAITLWTVPKV